MLTIDLTNPSHPYIAYTLKPLLGLLCSSVWKYNSESRWVGPQRSKLLFKSLESRTGLSGMKHWTNLGSCLWVRFGLENQVKGVCMYVRVCTYISKEKHCNQYGWIEQIWRKNRSLIKHLKMRSICLKIQSMVQKCFDWHDNGKKGNLLRRVVGKTWSCLSGTLWTPTWKRHHFQLSCQRELKRISHWSTMGQVFYCKP